METHILPLLSDYVLGLLPESDQSRLESHVAQCNSCRLALDKERQLEALVRQAVQVATQPTPARLRTLRPSAIPRKAAVPTWAARQLAPVLALVVLLAGTLVLQTTRNGQTLQFRAPVFSHGATPTMTSTSTPTATIAGLTQVHTAPREADSLRQTVAVPPRPAEKPAAGQVTVTGLATPVAAAAPQHTN